MLRSPGATPYRIGMVVLALATVAWRAWTVSRWTWHVDDWLYLDGTRDLGLVPYLFQDYNGHLMPAGFLVTWVMAKVAPLDFRVAVALVALTSGALVVLWGLALRRLAGERVVVLVPVALLSLSPLFVRPTIWWASAVQTLPLQAFMAASVLLVVRAARHPRPTDRWTMAVLLLCALLFWEKALLLLIPVAALAVHLATGSWRSRLRRAATLLLPTVIVVVAYVPLFVWRTSGTSANSVELSAAEVTGGAAAEFFARGVGEITGPGLLGGPWGTLPTDADIWIHQEGVLSFLFGAAVLMGALYVLTRIRDGWLLVGAALCYIAIAWGLILFSGRFQLVGQAASTTERFHADTFSVVVVLVTAALASHASRPGATKRPYPWAERAAVALTICSLAVSNAWQADRVGISPAKAWVAAVTHDVDAARTDATGSVALWEGTAPDAVLPAFWLEHAHLSNMLAVLPDVTFDAPAPRYHAVMPTGRLAPVEVRPDSRSLPGPVADCGYSVEPGGTVSVPMSRELFDWTWGLQLDTLAAEGGTLTVQTGGTRVAVPVGPGLQTWQAPFGGSVGDAVEVSMDAAGGTVCVAGLQIGNTVPGSP